MATENSTVNTSDTYEKLHQKLRTVEAMLFLVWGNSRDTFQNLSENAQDDYLCACHTLVSECQELCEPIGTAIYKTVPALA